jgi:hypothetical protein
MFCGFNMPKTLKRYKIKFFEILASGFANSIVTKEFCSYLIFAGLTESMQNLQVRPPDNLVLKENFVLRLG